MQERYSQKAQGKNWLFFGECNKALDFYYEDFWLKLEKENFLKLSLAFSRDQKEKVYVQHKLLENSKELWQWIQDGAHIYICGSAQKIAISVDSAFKEIFQKEGNMTEEKALNFLEQLQTKKIYVKDVY